MKNLPESSAKNLYSKIADKLEFTMATEIDSVMLKTILEKLTLLEESMKVLMQKILKERKKYQ